MNSEHLKRLIRNLIAIDSDNEISAALNRLNASLNELQKNNTKVGQQTVLNAGAKVVEIARRIFGGLSPEQRRDIEILKAGKYLSEHFPAEVEGILRELIAAPTATRDKLYQLIAERSSYLDGLTRTLEALTSFGIEDSSLEPGEAEIEALLPRLLFDNDLQSLHRELDALSKIIRTFYELNNITPERIELKHVSASDLVITVTVVIGVALAVGNAVKLCIDILNGAYSLRKAMREARSTKFVEEEIIAKIEAGIHQSIESRVKAAVAETMTQYAGEQSRRNELEQHALRAMTLLLERIDHGMQVIPRVGPPKARESGETPDGTESQVEQVNKLSAELSFPPVQSEPLLKLTYSGDGRGNNTVRQG